MAGSTSSAGTAPASTPWRAEAGVVRWGVVGASRIADDYMLPAIRACSGSEAVAIASRSAPGRAAEIATTHGVPRVYDSVETLLSDPAVQAVYIGSASDLHYEQVLAAAAAGKHVLCEKPLALRADEAVELIQACRDANVVLGVNHHLRNAATHRRIRRAVLDGAIGELRAARCAFTVQLPADATGWRTEGPAAGVAFDLTVHTADTLRFLLDRDVESVSALAANHGLCAPDLADVLFGTMRFDGGLLVSFQDAFTIGHAPTAVELYGTDGVLVGSDVMLQSAGGRVTLRRGGEVTELAIDVHHDLYEPAVRAFTAAVQGAGSPAASGIDGLRALEVAEAAVESARSGRVRQVRRHNPGGGHA